jgi:hypothetical protein
MLRLYPPRKGFSTNWRIRGTYLRIRVDQSSGTHKRPVALERLRDIESQIERKEWGRPDAGEDGSFLSAAVSYMETTGNSRYVAPLIKYFGETPWREIDQAAIDRAAAVLRPKAGDPQPLRLYPHRRHPPAQGSRYPHPQAPRR